MAKDLYRRTRRAHRQNPYLAAEAEALLPLMRQIFDGSSRASRVSNGELEPLRKSMFAASFTIPKTSRHRPK